MRFVHDRNDENDDAHATAGSDDDGGYDAAHDVDEKEMQLGGE